MNARYSLASKTYKAASAGRRVSVRLCPCRAAVNSRDVIKIGSKADGNAISSLEDKARRRGIRNGPRKTVTKRTVAAGQLRHLCR